LVEIDTAVRELAESSALLSSLFLVSLMIEMKALVSVSILFQLAGQFKMSNSKAICEDAFLQNLLNLPMFERQRFAQTIQNSFIYLSIH
jgi:hypothetical protein